MKTITYSQVWIEELWQAEQHIQARSKFKLPETQWLLEQGYEPKYSQRQDLQREQWIYTLEFQVPDEIVSYLGLRWPDQRYDIEVLV
jgi:hypothetical protein